MDRALVAMLLILQVADCLLTRAMFALGGFEANPVVWALSGAAWDCDLRVMAPLKVAAVALVAIIVEMGRLLQTSGPIWRRRCWLIGAACAWYVSVCGLMAVQLAEH